ncbi:hypothetical protein T492DRAFT_1004483 [Pavlovales sp. CCMP2436]|nr:hypothetical protein T492DRAFT_1004483 [Pavlovales sp. CCMP2436]
MCVARLRWALLRAAAGRTRSQGYQGYEDDAAPCGRHGRAAGAEARPRRGVGVGAHTLTPFGGLGRSLDLSLTSTKPVTEQHLLNHAEPLIYITVALKPSQPTKARRRQWATQRSDQHNIQNSQMPA